MFECCKNPKTQTENNKNNNKQKNHKGIENSVLDFALFGRQFVSDYLYIGDIGTEKTQVLVDLGTVKYKDSNVMLDNQTTTTENGDNTMTTTKSVQKSDANCWNKNNMCFYLL